MLRRVLRTAELRQPLEWVEELELRPKCLAQSLPVFEGHRLLDRTMSGTCRGVRDRESFDRQVHQQRWRMVNSPAPKLDGPGPGRRCQPRKQQSNQPRPPP